VNLTYEELVKPTKQRTSIFSEAEKSKQDSKMNSKTSLVRSIWNWQKKMNLFDEVSKN